MKNIESAAQTYKIDLAELLSRVDNDRELLRDLVAIFREDFPRHLEALRRAVDLRDMKQVKISGHTLKGMLSNLAVTRAAAAAAQLEQLAIVGSADATPQALAEFQREVEGLLTEMEMRTEEVRP